MSKTSTFLDLVKADKNLNPKNSYTWFQQNIRNLARSSNVTAFGLLGQEEKKQVRRILPIHIGKMVSYFYSPKGKDTLPFYDTFPLMLPFSFDGGYVTGLNLHYMHPRQRLIIFDKLQTTLTNEKMRLQFSWKVLTTLARMPEVGHCVKKYIIKNIKSNVIVFDTADYLPALFLPTESFRGATAEEVWQRSKGK